MKLTYTKKIIGSVIAAAVLLFSLTGGNVAVVDAAVGNPFNFGGMVDFTFFCDCSFNWFVVVSPPKPMSLSYNYTPQFRNYMLPLAGEWALGLYTPGSAGCWEYVPPYECVEAFYPVGTILPQVGTSL